MPGSGRWGPVGVVAGGGKVWGAECRLFCSTKVLGSRWWGNDVARGGAECSAGLGRARCQLEVLG